MLFETLKINWCEHCATFLILLDYLDGPVISSEGTGDYLHWALMQVVHSFLSCADLLQVFPTVLMTRSLVLTGGHTADLLQSLTARFHINCISSILLKLSAGFLYYLLVLPLLRD